MTNYDFDKAWVINLKRRKDRYDNFFANFDIDKVNEKWNLEVFYGVEEEPPEWFKASKGAWGCYRSHLKLLKRFQRSKYNNVIIFEDDALLVKNFMERWHVVNVPNDWDMLYLGGQPLKPLRKVNECIYRCDNVNRTHAYAINRKCVDFLIKHLSNTPFKDEFHVDSKYGEIHKDLNTYIIIPRLIGQRSGVSDVNGKMQKERFWT